MVSISRVIRNIEERGARNTCPSGHFRGFTWLTWVKRDEGQEASYSCPSLSQERYDVYMKCLHSSVH